jgi:signal transduction histidine kinase
MGKRVKLHDFIRSQMEPIVAEWEKFARTLGPGANSMDKLALRDHAKAMLIAIAEDIETYQSERMRGVKSRGEASPALRDTAATTHGGLRFSSQFSMAQLAAEFRALRATVLRLWIAAGDADMGDPLVRFNEAIDQALAESIDAFMARSNVARDLSLGVLGHDLRAPLATISSAADVLAHRPLTPAQAAELGGNVRRAARHMAGMIDNLIGYTHLQLAAGLSIRRTPSDAAAVCRDAITDAESTFSGRHIGLVASGDTTGEFDAVALRQLMTNLFVNALQHGLRDGPVTAELHGSAERVTLTVANEGEPLSAATLATLFEPLVRGGPDTSTLGRTSSGLGLFVAREVALAHGGTITAASSPGGRTTFEASLPRHGPGTRETP